MKKTTIIILILFVGISSVFSQEVIPSSKKFTIAKINTLDPSKLSPHIEQEKKEEEPFPGGNFDKKQLKELKKKSPWVEKRSLIKRYKTSQTEATILPPVKLRSFNLVGPYIPALDSSLPITGGTPLDNTMAISNGDKLITSFNSKIYAHDLVGDTALFKIFNANTISFSLFASRDSTPTISPFDPKLLYDPYHDRFILTFLSGRDKTDSKIIVAFSSSNNPADPWYVYSLPGNPRNTTDWTDYPAMAITKQDLFLTINLILDGVSWQSGFDGSIVWQMPLAEGYKGVNALTSVLWDDIKFNNKYIRNLHPVQAAMDPQGPDLFFLSNRNFSPLNDTIFLVHITDSIGSSNASLDIKMAKLDVAYGLPPNGIQADTDLNDPTTGLQTNDARWLGAFLNDGKIQFVGNTIDTNIGRSAIYHGWIENVYSSEPTYKGEIISDPSLDLAYPNIAFTGKEACEWQSIIAFDHTSITDYAGTSAVYFSNDKKHSDILRLKPGHNYVDNFLDGGKEERWGDYFGMQRKFNEPGKAWTAGFYGLPTKKSSIHVAELFSSDTSQLKLNISELTDPFNACEKTIFMDAENGISPYSFEVNQKEIDRSFSFNNCSDSTYLLKLSDQNNCTQNLTVKGTKILPSASVYPNPSKGDLFLQFFTSNIETIKIEIYDIEGSLIQKDYTFKSIAGNNLVRFNIQSMATGTYRILAKNDQEIVLQQTFFKID